MRATALMSLVSVLAFQTASAEPYWSQIAITTTPSQAPKVLAAADALMSSEVGKTFPGRMLLQLNVADGDDPSTHTFVPIYKSAADREKFLAKLQASEAWSDFLAKLDRLSEPGGTVLYRNVWSSGDINDSDDVWMAHAFAVQDPKAFLAAMKAFTSSETGKKSPGQVYLSAVVAGGISPVTHVVSVGYDSVEEMANWIAVRDASSDWARFLDASGKAADYLGGSLATDLKTWGPATMEEIAAQ